MVILHFDASEYRQFGEGKQKVSLWAMKLLERRPASVRVRDSRC